MRILLALTMVALLPLMLLAGGLIGLNREAMTTQVLRTHSVAAPARTVAASTIVVMSVDRMVTSGEGNVPDPRAIPAAPRPTGRRVPALV